MEVNCEGCAGCCLDWRPLVEDPPDHERRGEWEPLDDVYNLVPLTRADVSSFLDAGLDDAIAPRLWRAPDDGVQIDGVELAAIEGSPVFFLGLRKPPKPVAPFDSEPTWLPTCAFLDPNTLQCRIHDENVYPTECGVYPGHNLVLDAETECERVEGAFSEARLLDATPPEDIPQPLFGPHSIGFTVFRHPESDRLEGVIGRIQTGDLTQADRAEFVAAVMAGSPGTTATNNEVFESVYEQAATTRSWVSESADDWIRTVSEDPDPDLADRIEDRRGAPETPGW